MQQSLITPMKGVFPTRGDFWGDPRAEWGQWCHCKGGLWPQNFMQKAAWKKQKNSFVSWGREGVGTGCRLGITGLLRHGHRGAQRFPGSTLSSSPRAAPVPPRPILGLGMSQAAASLLGWGLSEEPVGLRHSPLAVGLRYSGCSEKLTWKKKRKKKRQNMWA